MTAPLYKDNQAPKNCDEKGNKGLWFDRFYDQFDANKNWELLKPSHQQEKQGNSHWLIKHFQNEKVGDDAQLKAHSNQQSDLAQTLQGDSIIFTTDWHLVTGMGNPHPVENGFAWHPTLGVPYLTGSTVKGIVRSYLESNLDEDDETIHKQIFKDWFGSSDKNSQENNDETETGNLIFFDALPIECPTLVVDIMTPHMGDWYQKGAESPNTPTTVPADWHDPVPIPFLATKNMSLLFSFGLRPRLNNDKVNIDLDDVKKVLTVALKYQGAGGKTATGYGSMEIDTKKAQEIEEESQQRKDEERKQQKIQHAKENMTPLAAEFYEYSQQNNLKEDKNAFWQNGMIEEWLAKIEETPDKELLQQIEDLMDIHFKGALQNPDKTQGKKNKAVYKPRVQEIAKRLNAL